MSNQPLVLGIETSCDETAVGIVRGRTLLANAFVCGALSNPHDRYGARVVWLASFAVALAALRAYQRHAAVRGILPASR